MIFSITVQTSAWKAKVIFWYVFLTSVIVFLFSAIGYLVYRYIHVGKEKHPANLVSTCLGPRLSGQQEERRGGVEQIVS
jgi:hypothetical protein